MAGELPKISITDFGMGIPNKVYISSSSENLVVATMSFLPLGNYYLTVTNSMGTSRLPITVIPIITGGDSSPPDDTPPSVVSTFPASGATGVPHDTIVTVTFSEPMDTDYYSFFGTFEAWNLKWSSDGKSLSWTVAEGNFKSGTVLSYAMNYTAADPAFYFRDLAGNILPYTKFGFFLK